MPVTMTLGFEGTRVTLTPSETQTVLRHVSELRRRLEFADDTDRERSALQQAVRLCVAAHTRVALHEIDVVVSEDGSSIAPRRARRPRVTALCPCNRIGSRSDEQAGPS